MPKPYLSTHPSGLYVRFRVPRDLRARAGFGSIVRSLRGPSLAVLVGQPWIQACCFDD